MTRTVLVTGADGFIGRNLALKIFETDDLSILRFTRSTPASDFLRLLPDSDVVIHLAGVNRPKDTREFFAGNALLTEQLCAAIKESRRRVPVIFASSIHAESESDYGRSKRAAEQALEQLHAETANPVRLVRLPNVFGKWARPNYNSVVATFCHNIARDLPIRIDQADAVLPLVYIDDVAEAFLRLARASLLGCERVEVQPLYQITVQGLADQLAAFRKSRTSLFVDRVGGGLTRALYATYVSYLPATSFVYDVPQYADARGSFVEMLKTTDSGQFSFFTAFPGVTRGGHYHHSKTEKFLVLRGKARFRFRSLLDSAYYEISTSGDRPQVVDTIPGWTHDITNVGDDELIVMLWANEVFDRDSPDTVARAL